MVTLSSVISVLSAKDGAPGLRGPRRSVLGLPAPDAGHQALRVALDDDVAAVGGDGAHDFVDRRADNGVDQPLIDRFWPRVGGQLFSLLLCRFKIHVAAVSDLKPVVAEGAI